MVGRTLACIQGPATSASAWQTIVESITNHRECEVELTNYDKSRRPFRHVVRVVPIDGPSGSAAFVRAIFARARPPRRLSPRRCAPATTRGPFLELGQRGYAHETNLALDLWPEQEDLQGEQGGEGQCGSPPRPAPPPRARPTRPPARRREAPHLHG